MIILTGERYEDGTVDVLCSECQSIVGRCDEKEVAALSFASLGVYCFDCEGVNWNDWIPGILMPNPGEMIVVGSIARGGVWYTWEAIGFRSGSFEGSRRDDN